MTIDDNIFIDDNFHRDFLGNGGKHGNDATFGKCGKNEGCVS